MPSQLGQRGVVVALGALMDGGVVLLLPCRLVPGRHSVVPLGLESVARVRDVSQIGAGRSEGR